jgi:hypothetical protein
MLEILCGHSSGVKFNFPSCACGHTGYIWGVKTEDTMKIAHLLIDAISLIGIFAIALAMLAL